MKKILLFWLLPVLAAAQSVTTPVPPPWQTGVVTPDGTCGNNTGYVCSPTWGACCSASGICGRSTAFCGEGCQPSAGNCDAPSTPAPGPGSVSPDGSCGGTKQYACAGSLFGDCCSSSGYCGSSTAHCGAGCQSLFGTCAAAGNVTTDGQCRANGKTCKGSTFGDCCSSGGWCGSTDGHCGPGCQANFGTCTGNGTYPPSGDISIDGNCSSNNKTCKGSTFGDCCSSSGFCGGTDGHCGPGCQVTFGMCTSNGTDPPADGISIDGNCSSNNKTCVGSTFGDCCSSSGFCGDTATHCGAGCQPTFGTCTAAGNVTTDGSCGSTGKVCKGSAFGNCCSSSGFCGSTTAHCGAGCQPAFGTCTGSGNVSIDGACGKNGKTCKGSGFGDCCSSSGFCGKTPDFCGAGCQISFGFCSGPSNITTDGSCGKNGKTCKGATFGDCCSASGFCGKTADFCGAGCQTGFGTCDSTAGNITTDGACGQNGKTCKGAAFGDCCSASGFCGKTADFCGAGCQPIFGTCDTAAGNITTDGACGKNGKTCKGAAFGDCCSASGFCGKTADFCGAGCQLGYGTCDRTAGNITTDGACGKNGKTCKGSTFGDCCSSSGFCGKTADFCGAGCQTGFGTCDTTAGNISTDGACGKNGKTCKGSTFGDCCSASGFCGKTTAFCGTGCQTGYGTCDTSSGNISTDGACSKNGKTCKGSTFGDCCSASGFCGKTTAFCGSGCQPSFGTCDAGAGNISTDGACGSKNGKTCVGSAFGNCCSGGGYCGNTVNHCAQGCQKASSSACLTTNVPSVDGSCGVNKGGYTCAGGDFNNQCCSSGGFCGTTTGHCATGCQRGYGRCN